MKLFGVTLKERTWLNPPDVYEGEEPAEPDWDMVREAKEELKDADDD